MIDKKIKEIIGGKFKKSKGIEKEFKKKDALKEKFEKIDEISDFINEITDKLDLVEYIQNEIHNYKKNNGYYDRMAKRIREVYDIFTKYFPKKDAFELTKKYFERMNVEFE